ncbi:MAG TPA: hypothetical protein DCS07_09195 [Bdellovibrionales bacterium]|nr:MAG: hypothetical protein A2Z97_10500 [Bdellovibrionales bacterium GWB1_52_6]OFZ06015.1 MAG: hypothetical protein A2X97_01620 [Bdellovibrionales bacterium GWA1_52_35]OFZ33046.1 MAG: hypothetical protein A2070_08075 [Bdellovibrionales bacterium GWC1_52_8]HAR42785.1 hypothetical protein [Bdellovibrionales bacterium]HCM39361.1 hypothetical protein [Bdellovibrionales bacterium]
MKTKLMKLVLVVALAFGATACSKIPAAYRGTFEDRSLGAKLTLKSTAAQLAFADGRVIQAKAEDLNLAAITEGKAGIFVRENSADLDLLEVFWINPNLASKQGFEGFVWFESELLYTLMNTKTTDSVPSLQLLHCTNGTVMIDVATQALQMGCPAGSAELKMVRLQN